VRAVFIPLHFGPHSAITLELPVSPTDEQISAATSTLIQRQVKVVMGQKDTAASALTWTLTGLDGEEPSDSSYYYRRDPLYFVFEIDDEAKLWVPCNLKMDVMHNSGGWLSSRTEDVVLGPFLVPCADSSVTRDLVAQMAEPVLAWIWRTDEPTAQTAATDYSSDSYEEDLPEPGSEQLPEEVRKVKATFVIPTLRNGDSKFVAIHPYCYSSWVSVDYTRTNLASTTVDLRVNGVSASRISLNALATRHVADKAVTPEPADGASTSISLSSCFELFALAEKLDENNEWFCPKCREFVQADKKIDIWSVPEVLVIQLKRFSGAGMTGHKIEALVDFQDELDLGPYVVGPQNPEDMVYRLYAVSEHSGSLIGGHYTAHAVVASGVAPEWYSFNDSSCYLANASNAHSELAYVLFYQRKSTTGVLIPGPVAPSVPVQTPTASNDDESSSEINDAVSIGEEEPVVNQTSALSRSDSLGQFVNKEDDSQGPSPPLGRHNLSFESDDGYNSQESDSNELLPDSD
jgi:hypothetical protein